MRYTISDIHGNLNGFMAMIDKINFSDTDELYVLGDVIDRGLFGIEILQYIMNHDNIKMLLGNHELFMIEALVDNDFDSLKCWTSENNGGLVTYESFMRLPKKKRNDILDYITSLPLRFNVEEAGSKYHLCHANSPVVWRKLVEAGKITEWPFTKRDFCTWDRKHHKELNELGKENDIKIIIGHTPTPMLSSFDGKAEPVLLGNHLLNIDCGSAYINHDEYTDVCRLACLRLGHDEVFYV
jgi:serine/threonine protein phosphatase 1